MVAGRGHPIPGQQRQLPGTFPHSCSRKCGQRQPSGQTGNCKMQAWISQGLERLGVKANLRSNMSFSHALS